MGQLSQFNGTATYDSANQLLEIKGTTEMTPHPEPALVAIHVAFKQTAADGSLRTEHATVPDVCLREPEWMVKLEGEFERGTATVFGLAIGYEDGNGSLHSQAWAQTIEIKRGYVHPDWDSAEPSSYREEVPVA